METKKLRNNLKVNRVSKGSKLFKIFTADNYFESQFISKPIYMHRKQQMYSKSIRPKTFYDTQAKNSAL